jgi:LacI family transcriptional regulator
LKKRHLHRPTKRRQVLLLQYWWEDRVFRGVARYATEHNWSLNCEMRWTGHLPKTPWHGDGIIAYVGIANPQKHLIDYIHAANVPVVETQIPHIQRSGRVIVPHQRIGEITAEHLLSLHFEHIGFVTFEENIFERTRRLAAMRTVKAAGAKFHLLEFATLSKQLAQLPKPLGLIALNDVNASSVILTCAAAGLSVPEEIAVIGVDDTEVFCDLSAVPLTSVNCDYERQGYEAAALLHSMMDGKPAPIDPIVIAPRGVTVRRSTDTVALPDLDGAKFLRFLRDNFRRSLSLEQTARDLDVPMRRVQNDFRVYLGRTVVQELTRLRVEYAKHLLQDSDLKLEAAGLESGFANRFHFIKAFVRVTGQTPRQYRSEITAQPELSRTMRKQS